jgi:plastocyanin
MRIPVRVVSAPEFEAWVSENTSAKPSAPPATLPPGAIVLDMKAEGIAYDKFELEVRADEPFAINFQNLDPQPVPHDIDIRAQDGTVLRDTPVIDGGQSTTYVYDALPAGTYTFICSIHPIPAMTGTLTVK